MAAEAGETADDRNVVRECAVAVQFVEIGEQFGNVVERVRTLRMSRDLRDLPRRQVRVESFVSCWLFFDNRSISSEISTAESSCTNRSSSILASSSAIGCSKSRNVVFMCSNPWVLRQRVFYPRGRCAKPVLNY
jgi:hypothetical protein